MFDDEQLDEVLSDGDAEAGSLFDVEPDWKDLWRGMPDYGHQDLQPTQSIQVHFRDTKDRDAFSRLVGSSVTANTRSIWYPAAEIGWASRKVWHTDAKLAPRYPVYIISKNRHESRLTSRTFEAINLPYHIVVEPQEYDAYASVIDPAKILVLPFSNLGQGSIPARNWVWEHAITSGAARHWIFDDNIDGLCRFQDNLKVMVDSPATVCALEDWVDRYENVKMAGFNYNYFASRKSSGIKPITLNTRIYSGILLSNDIPERWRGRYNEDTDLSLRILKAGYCTALFNAFLMYKRPTLTMKGGNTDQLYAGVEAVNREWEAHVAGCGTCKVDETPRCEGGREILSKDGRWLMADSLAQQHPNETIVARKWGRWQHQVDYRALRNNELIPAKNPPPFRDYGMTLQDMPEGISWSDIRSQQESSKPDKVKPTLPSGKFPDMRSTAHMTGAPPLAGPSLLDILKTSAALAKAAAVAPPPVMLQKQSSPAQAVDSRPEPSVVPTAATPDAEAFLARLKAAGHKLLTRDGKFFISDASRLTDEDRTLVKLHRDYLVSLAEPWVEKPIDPWPSATVAVSDESVFVSIAEIAPITPPGMLFPAGRDTALMRNPFVTFTPGASLADFLGTQRPADDWRPDEPPQLDGITDVVLNFATDGLRWEKGDRPVGVTVATMDGRLTRFLPFRFAHGGNLDETQVKRWALTELKHKRVHAANTRFDIHQAREWGVDLIEMGCSFTDIQHTAALLDDHRKQVNIDKLAADFLPLLAAVERVDESAHHQNHASYVAERERFTANLVWQLTDVFAPMIKEQELEQVHALEDRVIPAVVEMEKNGAILDVALVEQYHAECVRRHEQILLEVSREAGFSFDHTPTSWQRLFEKLGLPPSDSYAEDVIETVNHPLVKRAYTAAQYASLDSRTFKPWLDRVDANGVLRFDLNQLHGEKGGTRSGRFSSGLQQVPNAGNHRAVFGDELFPRRCFVGANGADYLEADAMQIEQRLLVHYAGNEKIIAEYADDITKLARGEEPVSYHKITWAMIKAYKPDMLYEHQKNFNFAFQYGAKSIKLAVMMKFITEREGDEIREARNWNDPRMATIKEIERAYNRMFPEAGGLLDLSAHLAKSKCDEFCKLGDTLHKQYPHRGYIKTYTGRRSRFPHNYKTYIALNRILQGTGADIMKQKLVELFEARKSLDFILRMTTHDSVGGDALTPETKAKVSAILNHQSFPLKVPILWSCGTGHSWADCK